MGENYLGKNEVNIDGEKEIAIIHFENKKLVGFGYRTDLDTSYNTGYSHYIEPIDRLNLIKDSVLNER